MKKLKKLSNSEIEKIKTLISKYSILNDKVKNLLSYNSVKVICSIDSLIKENYEQIRINAKFDEVMKNLNYLLDNNKVVSFSVTPTIFNMYEIPSLISFCVSKKISIKINFAHSFLKGAVHDYSKKIFLHQLPKDKLLNYIKFLENEFSKMNLCEPYKEIFENFINLIKKLDTNRVVS
jgi:MoaA/NifB/PqqE/SkfB family radical SAM enzyme